jgi:hypothetical protein
MRHPDSDEKPDSFQALNRQEIGNTDGFYQSPSATGRSKDKYYWARH